MNIDIDIEKDIILATKIETAFLWTEQKSELNSTFKTVFRESK